MVENKIKDNEEKAFKKFERWYYFLKDHKNKLKDKHDKIVQKVVNKNEKMEEKERTNDLKNAEILEKLAEGDKRRLLLQQNKAEHLQAVLKADKERYDLLLANKETFRKIREENSNIILTNQTNLINRANLKETSLSLNKLNV